MAERETHNQETRAGSSKSRRPRSLGRRLAIGIVGIGILYLVGVGLVSVVPQIFWPEKAELDASLDCASGLEDMRTELLDHSAEMVSNIGGPRRDRRAFFDAWDARHLGLEERCEGDEHVAWDLLGRLRQRMEGSLERIDEEEGSLARRMDDTLAHRATER